MGSSKWTLVIYVITMITVLVIAVLVREKGDEVPVERVPKLSDQKIYTYTHHTSDEFVPDKSELTEVAGLDHCERCMLRMFYEGVEYRRKTKRAPPAHVLANAHNKNRRLPEGTSWDLFYDMDHLKDLGILMNDESKVIHEYQPTYGKIVTPDEKKTVKYINPEKRVSRTDSTDIVASSWNNGRIWLCYETRDKKKPDEVVTDYLYWANLHTKEDVFKPSKQVLYYVQMCEKQIGESFVTLHIRRGDVMDSSRAMYAGIPGHIYVQMVEPSFIVPKLKKELQVSQGSTLVIFSNEENQGFFDDFKTANNGYYNLIFERDLQGIQRAKEEIDITFFEYMIAREIFKKGRLRLGSVYPRLGQATHYLADYLSELGFTGEIE